MKINGLAKAERVQISLPHRKYASANLQGFPLGERNQHAINCGGLDRSRPDYRKDRIFINKGLYAFLSFSHLTVVKLKHAGVESFTFLKLTSLTNDQRYRKKKGKKLIFWQTVSAIKGKHSLSHLCLAIETT